jgi:hypothetical protein
MKHMPQSDSPSDSRPDWSLAFLLIAAILLLFAPNGDSFWIDEANSANMAVQPGLDSWWKAVNHVSSDVQMSPYFLQLWAWQKLAGTSEWAFRCNNLPWVLLGLGAWFLALPRPTRGAFALLAGVSPFLWYYTSEIRPYAMLFGASSLMFASLFGCAFSGISKPRVAGFGLGALLAIGASAAALPWAGTAFLLLVWVLWKQRADRSYLPLGVVLGLLSAALAGLYLWSFTRGNRAASPEPSSLGSLLFVPYELLGFTGLGPGRTELRSAGIGAIKHSLPQLALLGITLVPVVCAGLAALRKKIGLRGELGLIGLVLLPVMAVVALGFLSGLRTTGRHFTPALALLLPLMAAGMTRLWIAKPRWRPAVVLFLVCLGFSSAQIHFAARHKKDNYREAARIARAALDQGKKVWWVADSCGANYYRVPTGELADSGTARLVNNMEKRVPEQPDLVVLSRPDVYDNSKVVTEMLAQSGFLLQTTLQSFTIWQRPEQK